MKMVKMMMMIIIVVRFIYIKGINIFDNKNTDKMGLEIFFSISM